MQEEQQYLDRRGFLKLGGAGVAVAGTKATFPSLLFGEEEMMQLTDRSAPGDPIHLRSPLMEVVLEHNDSVLFAFHLLANGAMLRGEDLGKKFAKRGIDVSSEALRYPMIGHISNFW
jgi:hypothetical protein